MIKTPCKAPSPQGFFSLLRQPSILRKILNLVPGASSFCVIEKEEALGTKL